MRFQISKPVLSGKEKAYVLEAVESGWISSNGRFLEEFERGLAQVVGVDECIAVSNGTVALHLACLALELAPGDEVIVPSLTYVATANAVAYCGAIPVMGDCDLLSWNMRADVIESLITPRTKGVIAVHLYGLPCEIDKIEALCRNRGLWLIEDCAESLGATVHGRQTGSFGDAATFSFYGNKTISTGEGGAVIVRDPERRARARLLRGQGMDPLRRYWHPVIGYNYRMTNVAAAIGCGQLEQIDYHLGERRRIAETYRRALAPLAESGMITLPVLMDGYDSSNWLFGIVLQVGGPGARARLMSDLARRHGIETRPFFVPMHRLPMYQTGGTLPNTEFLGDHGVSLPTFSGLTKANIIEIVGALGESVRDNVICTTS